MLGPAGSAGSHRCWPVLRRKQILEELRAKGGVRLTELSEELSVSEMTIRRDLDALQKDGLIERVHGGAVLAQLGTEEPGFEKKVLREQAEKAAIAERAAALVKPGSAVALSAGTTTLRSGQPVVLPPRA